MLVRLSGVVTELISIESSPNQKVINTLSIDDSLNKLEGKLTKALNNVACQKGVGLSEARCGWNKGGPEDGEGITDEEG